MKKMKWRRFLGEIALCIGLVAAVAAYVVPVRAQNSLAGKMTRLHVLANSDSAEDQSLKLKVRDRILREAGYEYGSFTGQIDEQLLERLRSAAQDEVYRQGYRYPVSVSRQTMYFDTRHYEGFSLPAGQYDAVRVIIGEGAGQNWWCVLFPPLCLGAAEQDVSQVAQQAGLSDEDIALIREDGTGYIVRFRLAEAWGRLREWLS